MVMDTIPVGDTSVGNPHLLPVQDPLVALFLGSSLDAGHIGTGARLGDTIRLK